MEMMSSAIVTLVLKILEIVIHMKNVKMVLFVDQTIAKLHLVLTLKLIVVINQLLEMNSFVHLEFCVEKMKGIVILMMSVRVVLVVPVVQPILDSIQIYIVAQPEELIMEDGVFVHTVIPVALMKVTVAMIITARMV